MPVLTGIIQIIIPVLLICWLLFKPAYNSITYVLQAAGVVLFLFALSRIAIWGTPPYWTPYLYALLWVIAVAVRFKSKGFEFKTALPEGKGWINFSAAAILFGISGTWTIFALEGSKKPNIPVLNIATPLGPGTYLVASGGSHKIINPHLETLNPRVRRYRSWRGQSYAIDLVKISRMGFHRKNWSMANPANYEIFGTPVLAPCDAKVIAVENSLPDNRVPNVDTQNKAGNHVLLQCSEFEVLLAHLKAGSVIVKMDDLVSTGDFLGKVGNSGQSFEPHLHVHAQGIGYPGITFSGAPYPIAINNRYLVRNDLIKDAAQ